MPGHDGSNAGRPKEKLRADMRGDLEAQLPVLRALNAKGELDPIKYAEFLAKFGLGTKNEDELTVADKPRAALHLRRPA